MCQSEESIFRFRSQYCLISSSPTGKIFLRLASNCWINNCWRNSLCHSVSVVWPRRSSFSNPSRPPICCSLRCSKSLTCSSITGMVTLSPNRCASCNFNRSKAVLLMMCRRRVRSSMGSSGWAATFASASRLAEEGFWSGLFSACAA